MDQKDAHIQGRRLANWAWSTSSTWPVSLAARKANRDVQALDRVSSVGQACGGTLPSTAMGDTIIPASII